jgi:hypothetical protein
MTTSAVLLPLLVTNLRKFMMIKASTCRKVIEASAEKLFNRRIIYQ